MDLSPPRGTRDFFPEDLLLRTYLFDHFREVARVFGFEEYDAPVLESEELYVRKAGEEITDQLYNFEDKGGRKVTLRPEMTPSLARMVLQKGRAVALPIKWFSIPQCFRYERMTRGRKREHYQWNMDILGVPGVTAEAELLAAVTTFFRRVGLGPEEIGIKVSSRRVLQSVLDKLGVSKEQFAPVCVVVDKLGKLPRDAIETQLNALSIDRATTERIFESLTLRTIVDLATHLGNDDPAVRELKQLFDLATDYGYGNWLTFDASIVRGLAYYTGVVFEAFDRGEQLRAICGGGRYDRLLSTFGGDDVPACGFGFGDVVIVEVLKDRGKLPALGSKIDDVVFPFDASLRPSAIRVATALRAEGRSVELVLEDKKAKWALKHASRLHASRLWLLGPDEFRSGAATVRDMTTGEEALVPLPTP